MQRAPDVVKCEGEQLACGGGSAPRGEGGDQVMKLLVNTGGERGSSVG